MDLSMEDYEDGFTPAAARYRDELNTLLDDIRQAGLEVKVKPDGSWWIRDPKALLAQTSAATRDHGRITLGRCDV